MATLKVRSERESTQLDLSSPAPPLPSEALLALFQFAPFAQLVILPDDPLFTIAAVNDAYLTLVKVKRHDIVGKGVFEVFPDHPANPAANGLDNLRASLRRVISTRSADPLPLQDYDVKAAGEFEQRYWKALNTPLPGKDGRVQYILHSVEEITDKVIAEQRASAERLRQAERAGRIGSFEWLRKDNRVHCTPELEALYGLGEGAFQTGFENWSKWVLPQDAELIVAKLKDCIARKDAECVCEFRVLLPGGKLRWLRGQAKICYDESGVVQRLIGVNFDIDAQKRAEEHLRESEQRLRAIYDGTYEYIGLLNPEGTLLEANRASLEFARNTRDDVVGRPFWNTPWFASTPGAPEQVRQAIKRAAAGEFVRFEASLFRPSGECQTFDISFHPVQDDSGNVVLIVPEGRNITERKLVEERLQQQWQTFDTALSNTPDFTYTFDLEGRFTYVNSALLSLWQKSLPEAMGKNFLELGYPPELAARLQREIQEVIAGRQTLHGQTPFSGPKGEIRHYEYIFVPVIAANGTVEAVAGSTRDMTDRERMAQALADSVRKVERIFAQAPVAIIVLRGRDFIVEMANPTYHALLPGRELVGRAFMDIVPELGPAVLNAFHRVLDTGEPFIANEWHVPYDSNADGSVEDHWFNVVYNPLRGDDGAVSGIISVSTDVTVQVLARKELERVNRELEEYSYVASHDLQEPLRVVNIYTHLLLRGLAEPDQTISQYATFVRQGVQRMEILLKDLLTFSRTVHLEPTPVGTADLSASLSEALSVLNSHLSDSAAVVTAGTMPSVRGDTQQMAHVFQNLISNAIKYRKKDLPPAIRIWAERQDQEWVISVEDNGIGFEPQYSERIFGLFKRLHRDEYPGTGMGLAICQRIVGRFGGRMWAEGRLGEGAIFRFSLSAPIAG